MIHFVLACCLAGSLAGRWLACGWLGGELDARWNGWLEDGRIVDWWLAGNPETGLVDW